MKNFSLDLTNRDILIALRENRISIDEARLLIAKREPSSYLPTSSLNTSKTADHEDLDGIAIIGMSGRFPGANDLEQFWHNLSHGIDSVSVIPESRWRITDYYDPDPTAPYKSYSKYGGVIDSINAFDPLFFNISPKEAELMDPQHRLFLEEVWKAFEDAGYSASDLNGMKCSVYAGYGEGDYKLKLKDENIQPDAHYFTGNAGAILPARVSYFLNLKGESIAVDTACSSSLVALHLACQSIRHNDNDLAVAGGISLFTTPMLYVLASKAGMLSPDGKCKAFDNKANGFVPAEGVGVVILKSLKKAIADKDHIYGVIKGTAVNQDGRTNGITAPSAVSQTELESELYNKIGISPETIDYIETHGTGTKLGDPIEISALSEAFRKYTHKKQFCLVGSVKTNIGHTQLASGMAGLIKILLCLKYKKLVPSLHYEAANEHIDFEGSPFCVNTKLIDWENNRSFPRRAAVSAFGFSGTNAHVLVEECSNSHIFKHTSDSPYFLIPLSAKTEIALRKKIADLLNWLNIHHDQYSIEPIAFTLLMGREHYNIRTTLIASSVEDLMQQLTALINSNYLQLKTNDLYSSTKQKEPLLIKAGNEAIDTLLQSKSMEDKEYFRIIQSLGELYFKGYSLSWNKLYRDECYRRISMPTYPFSDTHYYAKDLSLNNELISNSAVEDNIDEQISCVSYSSNDCLYSIVLQGDEFYIADHVVKDECIFPGIMYLELAYKAIQHADPSHSYKIKNFVWLQPLVFYSKSQCIYIRLTCYDAHDYKLDIYTVSYTDEEIIHAQGRLGLNTINSAYAFNDKQTILQGLNAIKSRCINRIDKQEHYENLRSRGMLHGQSLQAIHEVFYNENEVLAELRLPESLSETFEKYALHPSILDNACQAVIGLIKNKEDISDALYLPFSLGEINLIKQLTKHAYAYITFSRKSNQSDKTKYYRIIITDYDGRILAILDDFILRPVIARDKLENTKESKLDDNLSDVLCVQPSWKEEPLAINTSSKDSENFLLFDSDAYLATAWRSRIDCSERKMNIVLVERGVNYQKINNYHYTINPQVKDDYRYLVKDLITDNLLPTKITYLWLQDIDPDSLIAVDEQLQRSFYSLFYFIQIFLWEKLQNSLSINLAYFDNHDGLPAFRALYGFAKSLQLEHPGISIKLIELSGIYSLKNTINLLDKESSCQEIQLVRYKSNKRYVRDFEEFSMIPYISDVHLLKQNGVYIIVGGMGGIGMQICHYLSTDLHATLILMGRSSLGDKQKRVMDKLRAYGSNVSYIQVDVSHESSLQSELHKVREQCKKIDGIFYCAGIQRGSTFLNKNQADIDETFKAKIHGLWNIDRHTSNDKLDVFVIFSSVSGILGNIGQTDYSYANCYLDSFANWRTMQVENVKRYGSTISMAWPLWLDGGMHVSEEVMQSLQRSFGISALDTNTGISLLKAGLNCSRPTIAIIKGDLNKIRPLFGLAIDEGKLSKDLQPRTKEINSNLYEDIILILSSLMKIDKALIAPDKKFNQYGFDSITFTEFSNRINAKFNIDIMPAVFFEYDSLRSFCAYVNDSYHSELQKYYELSAENNARLAANPHEQSINKLSKSLDEVKESNVMRDQAEKEPIAIIGMFGLMPESDNLNDFWKKLIDGFDFIKEIPDSRWNWREIYGDPKKEINKTNIKWGSFIHDVDKFDAKFFNISPREASLMDPQQRILMEVIWKTIEDAGYKASELAGSRTGVFMGVSTLDYAEMLARNGAEIQAYTSTGRAHSVLANRISYFFDFHGPSEPIDTACSSSLIAIHHAVRAIQNSDCDVCIAGGINLMLSPELYIAFSKASMLSPDGKCKTFDESANGYVRGEGAGAVILKPLSKAISDKDHIYAVIRSSVVNHGGRANSLTAPNANSQIDLLVSAYQQANVPPDTVTYIEAHGTGTRLGDPVEINALKSAFKKLYDFYGIDSVNQPHCGIGTVKSNIGHLEAAAGIAGVIKVLLALQHKMLPPSININKLNSQIKLESSPFYIVREASTWHETLDENESILPRRAGISSFGFGGANAHIVLEEYLSSEQSEHSHSDPQIIILSSEDPQSLKQSAYELSSFLQGLINDKTRILLRDIAYTLQVGREEFSHRIGFVARSIEEAVEYLRNYSNDIFCAAIFMSNAHYSIMADVMSSIDSFQDNNETFLGEVIKKWIMGGNIPWEMLPHHKDAKRISLPGYIFLKDSYWFTANRQNNFSPIANALHPLVDVNQSTFKGMIFKKKIHPQEFFIRDHCIGDKTILPGAAYLEIAKAAAFHAYGYSINSIKDVIWAAPIEVFDANKEIYIEFIQDVEHINFEIFSYLNDKRHSHSKGKILNAHTKPLINSSQDALNIEEIIARCATVRSKSELYEKFKNNGFNYGETFKVIDKSYSNEVESLVRLTLPSSLHQDFSKYDLHVSLVDGAFQAIMAIDRPVDMASNATYVPFGLEELSVMHPLTTECYAYVYLDRKYLDKSDGIKKYDISIVDEKGRRVVHLKNFTARKIKSVDNVPKILTSIHFYHKETKPYEFQKRIKNSQVKIVIFYDLDREDTYRQLKEHGHFLFKAIGVKHSDTYQKHSDTDYRINSRNLADYRQLIMDLAVDDISPYKVIYLCANKNVSIDALHDGEIYKLYEDIEQLTLSLKYLQQACYEIETIKSLDCFILAPLVDNHLSLSYSPLTGFCRSITNGNTKFRAITVQIDKDTYDTYKLLLPIVEELVFLEKIDAHEISCLKKSVYQSHINRLIVNNSNIGAPIFKKGGVYLIAGGGGEIGKVIANYLAINYQAKIILVGRSARQDLFSSEVVYERVDITNTAHTIDLIDRIKRRFKALNGIFHLAGTVVDKFITKSTDEEIRQVLAPKIIGTMNLDIATQHETLDFFMLFSSISAVIGDFGACSYAMANAFMDHYALLREQWRIMNKRYGKTYSINWPILASGGMKLPKEESEKYYAYSGMSPFTDQQIFHVLETLSGIDDTQIIVASGDVEKIDRLLKVHAEIDVDMQEANTSFNPLNTAIEHQVSVMENKGELLKRTEIYLKEVLSGCIRLPVDKIESSVSLEKYGIDSMMIMEVNDILEKNFNSLPRTLFFEYTDIKGLAGYFVEHHKEKLSEIFNLSKLIDEEKEIVQPQRNSTIKNNKSAFISEHKIDDKNMDIAIIGVSGRYPMARNIDEFYERLKSGKDCIEEVPKERWDIYSIFDPKPGIAGKSYSKWGGFINDIDKFDSRFFNVIPKIAKMLDPQERIFLETVWEAIEDSGYTPDQLINKNDDYRASDVAVYLGVMYDDYKLLEAEEFQKRNYEAMTGYWNASLANRVSYAFNFRGPSLVIDTACSSSLIAIHLACESLLKNECKIAIAGGVNLSIHPSKYLRLSALNMASSEGKCRAFGEGGDGYVPGEGVGAIILKPLHKAVTDGDNIYAVIKGSCTNHGGKTNGFSVPNPNAQADLITQTLEKTGIDPRTISYIESHGTGTELGDPIEIAGLTKSYRRFTPDKQFCSIGSVKSNIGHCEGAAGVAAVTKTMLQLKNKELFPSLHANPLNRHINFKDSPFYVQQELSDWPSNGELRRAGVSSFGAGGANAHVIMEEYPFSGLRESEANKEQLILISAHDEEDLNEYVKRWLAFLRKTAPNIQLKDIAYTSQVGRVVLNCRLALVASTKEEVVSQLSTYADGKFDGYIGNASKSKTNFGDTKEDIKYINDLISAGQLHKIAKIWVEGAHIDFISTKLSSNYSRVSLPCYPFKRERHWIPIHTDEILLKSNQEASPQKAPHSDVIINNIPDTVSSEAIIKSAPDSAQIFSKVVDYLKGLLAEVTQLSVEAINAKTEFTEFGIDSISLAEFSNKIIREIPEVMATSILAYQTIDALAAYIIETNIEALTQKVSGISVQIEDIALEVASNDDKKDIKILSDDLLSNRAKLVDYFGRLLANILKIPYEQFKPNISFTQYGIDSIHVLELLEKISRDIPQLPESIIYAYQTVNDLVDYILVAFGNFESRTEGSSENQSLEGENRLSEVESHQVNNDESIAIIGMAGRYPSADNLQQLWENLRAGHSAIEEIPTERWDYKTESLYAEGLLQCKWGAFIKDFDKFDASFFKISPKEAASIDPQERLFLEVAWHVLEDAGYTKHDACMRDGNVGVFVGITNASYSAIGIEGMCKGENISTRVSFASIPNRVSYHLNLSGPSMPVDTMCSSSLTAIHLACEHIRMGKCRLAIAGGVNLYTHPSGYLHLEQAKLLSQDGKTRSFGQGGQGFVPGEAVGAVLLKPLTKAKEDGDHIYAIIKGSAINHYGHTNGYFVPSSLPQTALIRSAIQSAGIAPETVSYIETQTVGSEIGDAVEVEGIRKAFKELENKKFASIALGSVKPNLGHAESASGMVQLAKVISQMKYKELLPTQKEVNRNPDIKLENTPFYIQYDHRKWQPQSVNGKLDPLRAGISGFGAGGSSAHILVEEYDDSINIVDDRLHDFNKLFVLSAKTKEQLKAMVNNLRLHLEAFNSSASDNYLTNVAYTLHVGREAFTKRLAIIAKTKHELISKLDNVYVDTLVDDVFINDESEFISGKQEEVPVDANLTQSVDLIHLAKQWVAGAKIDWISLYHGMKTKRVSLPGYPFTKKRCWVQTQGQIRDDKKINKKEVIRESESFDKDAIINAINNTVSMMRPFWGLTILSYLLGLRIFEFNKAIDIDVFYKKLSKYRVSRALCDQWLRLLAKCEFIEVSNSKINLCNLTDEVIGHLNNLSSRRELLARAFPEFSAHFELLAFLKDNYTTIFRKTRSAEQILTLNRVRGLINHVYFGQHRLTKLIYPTIKNQVKKYIQTNINDRHGNLRVLEIGIGTFSVGNAIIEECSLNRRNVSYHFIPATKRLNVTDMFQHRHEYSDVEFHLVDDVSPLKKSYDIIVLQLPSNNSYKSSYWLGRIKSMLADKGFIIIAEPIELEYLELTFQVLDIDELSSFYSAPHFLSANSDELLDEMLTKYNYVIEESIGKWLNVVSNKQVIDSLRLTSDNVIDNLKTVYAHELGLDMHEINFDAALEDYGINSILQAKIFSQLYDHYKYPISPEQLLACKTLSEVKNTIINSLENDSIIHRESLSTKNMPEKESIYIDNKAIYLTEINGLSKHKINYYHVGDGEPIVLLTALAFKCPIWKHQIEFLSRKYKVILPNFPGHGSDSYNGNALTFENLSSGVIEVLDDLNLDAAHIIGWCMAGNIAQLIACNNPDRVKSLSLVCTTPVDVRLRGLSKSDLDAYSVNPLGVYQLEYQNIYQENYFNNSTIQQHLDLIKTHHCKVDSRALFYYLNELFSFNTLDKLSDIKIPSLIISGQWDISFPPEQVSILHEKILGSRYYNFKLSGHMPFLSEHDEFNKVLDGFLSELNMT